MRKRWKQISLLSTYGSFDTQFNDITHLDVAVFFIKLEDNITYLIDDNNVEG